MDFSKYYEYCKTYSKNEKENKETQKILLISDNTDKRRERLINQNFSKRFSIYKKLLKIMKMTKPLGRILEFIHFFNISFSFRFDENVAKFMVSIAIPFTSNSFNSDGQHILNVLWQWNHQRKKKKKMHFNLRSHAIKTNLLKTE